MKKPNPKSKRSKATKKAAAAQAPGGPPAASRHKSVLAGLAAGTVLIVAGTLGYDALTGFLVPQSRTPPPAADSGAAYIEQAKVHIVKEERELGTMRVSDERTAEFFLPNMGGKPLELSQVRTSCMCTFAQVVIDDEKSPLFNMEMHNAPAIQSWKGVVEPSLTPTVRVIYRPSLMPVEGSVARNVKFNTNDPSRPDVELGVHATVQ
ncbi:MAG: hypothetical protein TEF_14385 [Rhizobiales bacterium NRL2]|jgi:hypothetical protein|nr:MAG: hypothetical protein TEF_14385 [Rhizobiales bacterium NRL2]